ncbi:MAG TPA: M20 family metallopeptidase [Streptosporangiaceae bacterium]
MSPDLAGFARLLSEQLDAVLPGAGELRRRVHQDPELSWQEHRTSAAVAAALAGLEGLTAASVADPGLLVRAGQRAGPAVGLRAELDALPLAEQTGASFASANGAMHACGHDVHLAALVAVLLAFGRASLLQQPPAALLGVFQPSEEASPSGAVSIAGSGLLQQHQVRAMLAVHVHPGVGWGSVATGAGAVNAGSDSFVLTVTGSGGHAAYPHQARDPVLALSQVIVALQQVVSRRTDPMHPVVVSVCRLLAGTAANVIPATAVAEGTIRVLRPDDRQDVLALITSIAGHAAAASGCQARLDVTTGDPALVNDAGLAAATDEWLRRSGLTVAEPMRSCGSDDFAYYRDIAPSLMMFLGVADAGAAAQPGLHHAAFLPPDEAVAAVARAMIAGYAAAAGLVAD